MKTIDRSVLMDWWLQKYHNTTCEEVVRNYPEEAKTPQWFKLYPVTQKQHDEWEKWAKDYVKKVTKLPKKYIDRHWGFVYLDCSPDVIKEID